MTDEKRLCPACGSHDVVPILYGDPTEDMAQRSYGGDIVLGGCIMTPRSPTELCRACGEYFGELRDHTDRFEGLGGYVPRWDEGGTDATDDR